MKTSHTVLLLCGIFYMPMASMAQESSRIPLIGDKAPSFTAQTTQGLLNFPEDQMGKWKILFSHPSDFTSVCSSEIFELSLMQEEFRKLNTAIYVLSTDGLNSHIQWIKSIEELRYKDRTAERINFPLIADDRMEISRKYGMIHPSANSKKTIRAVFIIDSESIIRMISYYPSEVGRNMEEVKRTLIALQHEDRYDIITPANWQPGQDVMIPSPASIEEANKLETKKSDSLYNLNWYMWFRKLN